MMKEKVYRKSGLKCLILTILAFAFLSLNLSVQTKAETVKKYTIKFDGNDGNGVFLKETKLRGTGLKLPMPTVTYEGFGFVGWALDKNVTNPDFLASDYYTEDKNVTLYAIWHVLGDTSTYYTKPSREIAIQNQTVKKKKSIKLKPVSIGEGKAVYSYKSSNKKILKVSSTGKITGLKKGKAKVTITAKEDGMYAKSTKTITVKVK